MNDFVQQLGKALTKVLPFFLTYLKAWWDKRQSYKIKKLEEKVKYNERVKNTIDKLDDSEHLDWVQSKSFRD